MKIPCFSFFAAALLVGVPLTITSAAPQTSTASQSSSQGASGQDQIAPGSLIPVELAKTIDAKKAKPGDPVVAKIPGELRDNAGQVAIPAGAKVVGHVTEAKGREKGESRSMLGIAWDKIVLKEGREIPLVTTIIQAVAAPPRMAGGGYGPMSESGGMPGSMPGQPAGGMAGGMSRPAGAPAETGTSSRSNTGNPAGGTGNPSGAASGAQLTLTSQGVLGMEGFSLGAGTNGQGSVISSEKKNVKLESGTQMLLRVGS